MADPRFLDVRQSSPPAARRYGWLTITLGVRRPSDGTDAAAGPAACWPEMDGGPRGSRGRSGENVVATRETEGPSRLPAMMPGSRIPLWQAGRGVDVMDDTEFAGPPANQADDRSTLIVRGFLFLSSYAPLFVILAIRFQGTALRAVCAGLALIGFAYLAVVLWVIPRTTQQRAYSVDAVKDASGEVAGYRATYLVPFVTVASPSAADLVGYCIFAVVVLVIFMRSDLAQINPALYLLGRRVASITAGRRTYYLVCRRLPRPSARMEAARVAGLLVRKE
jgi:hypothetical protein